MQEKPSHVVLDGGERVWMAFDAVEEARGRQGPSVHAAGQPSHCVTARTAHSEPQKVGGFNGSDQLLLNSTPSSQTVIEPTNPDI